MVLDTGALKEEPAHSLYTALIALLGEARVLSKEMLVVHTHGHSDHTKGDIYFKEQENVTLVEASKEDIEQYLGFNHWPNEQKKLDLGGREVTLIPTPGHQEESISFYDHETQWLMTGDTLYPGVIYIKDWQAYRESIKRLIAFTQHHQVTAIMGAHIEMITDSTSYYPIGSTYQPEEARLELSLNHLKELEKKLRKFDKPTDIIFGRFIIRPMGWFQRTLSNIVRMF